MHIPDGYLSPATCGTFGIAMLPVWKSHALSEDVHMAMVSRGCNGNVRTVAPARIATRDVVWALACAAAVFFVLGGDRVLGR